MQHNVLADCPNKQMWRNSFSMSTGRRNTLAGQIAEHLVCAELAKRDLLTTTFSGNVPQFDVLATDASCRTVPIQVKASRGSKWPSNAKIWMDIELDPETGTQIYQGPAQLPTPELVYVCVSLEEAGSQKRAAFSFFLWKICRRSAFSVTQTGWARRSGSALETPSRLTFATKLQTSCHLKTIGR